MPSKRTLPATVRPSRAGSRRSTESAATLLPQPDSPTMPSVSPGPIANDTPSTARVIPSSVKNWVLRPSTSQQGRGHRSPHMRRAMRGSRRSRRPSPTRLTASTTSASARPGQNTVHGALAR